jgi:hypothetical protein
MGAVIDHHIPWAILLSNPIQILRIPLVTLKHGPTITLGHMPAEAILSMVVSK